MTHEQSPPRRVTFRVRTLLLVVAAAAILLSVPSCLTAVWQTLEDTTYYPSGYSEQKFRSVSLGMDESEVTCLLGQPVETRSAVPQISWYYGPSTLRVTEGGGLWDTRQSFDTGLGFTIVNASQDDQVVNVFGGFLGINAGDLVGQRLTDIRQRFGEPRCVRIHPSSKYLVYSGTKESGSYYTRQIGLDAKGRVNKIIAGWYQD